jgi:endonuclease/exonuclease/phosphatase family metal-dependent hydrolase
VGALFDDPGFVIASFNVLGASHTRRSKKFPVASVRMTKEYRLLQSRKVDVAGLQELQAEQATQFDRLSRGAFGSYHFVGPKGRQDTENSLVWRKSRFQFLSGQTYDVPYFNGNIRHMPVVLLRDKRTGRSAYFMNTHNPADVNGRQQQWRDRAVQIERQKMLQLTRTGRAVFLTGDFNDHEEAFCPLTAKSLATSPNSVPSMACAYPGGKSIDWMFAAGPTRFSWYLRDTSPQAGRLSDHPLLLARAHLRR